MLHPIEFLSEAVDPDDACFEAAVDPDEACREVERLPDRGMPHPVIRVRAIRKAVIFRRFLDF